MPLRGCEAVWVEKVNEIDVTRKSVEKVVEEIINVLNGRREAGVGRVNWLGRLEEENRLDEFFTYLNWL